MTRIPTPAKSVMLPTPRFFHFFLTILPWAISVAYSNLGRSWRSPGIFRAPTPTTSFTVNLESLADFKPGVGGRGALGYHRAESPLVRRGPVLSPW